MATVRLLVLVLGLLGPHWPNKVSANWMYLGISGASPSSYLYQQHPTVGPRSAEPEDPMGPTAEVRALCSSLPGIQTQQVEVCLQQPGMMTAVAAGAARGIEECKHQFQNERWNCSTHNDENTLFGTTLERGSKETAFIYAVTSAGVVHAVTQACSSGNLTDCSCDSSKQGQATEEGWKWGGCSDNLKFGVTFTRSFVDVIEKRKKQGNIRAKMNLHNNAAGRKVVSTLMGVQCRCHGVSGSCEIKTCWHTMPSFNKIGDELKKKYGMAVQVSANAKNRLRRKIKAKRRVDVKKGDLVHIHKSPNYCVEDVGKGIPGTAGRVCNKSSTGPDSCGLLCCGRGYNTQVKKHIERCHCKFVWCCYVKCKTCETTIDLHTCK